MIAAAHDFEISFALPQLDSDIDFAVSQLDIGFASSCGIIKHDRGFALIQFDFGFAISEADTNCPHLNLTSASHYLNLTLAPQDVSPKLQEVCPKLVQHSLDKSIAMLFYKLTKHVLTVIQIRFQNVFELSLSKQNT